MLQGFLKTKLYENKRGLIYDRVIGSRACVTHDF